MNDDQSGRDHAAGPTGVAGQAGDSPQPGSSGAGQRGSEPVAVDSAGGTPRGSAPAGSEPGGDQAARGESPAEGEQAAQQPAGKKQRKRHSLWSELVVLVPVALVVALLIKTFLVQAFFIPSSSMEDTLLPGDKVVVNKIVYHLRPIHVGDIVVFDGAGSWDPAARPAKPSSDPIVTVYRDTLGPLLRSIAGLFGTAPGQTDYVKRVLGVPGDRVACCNAQGRVTVNGVALRERSYLFPGAAPSEIRFSIVVPRGRLWVMGDNRLVSDDSRLHTSDPGNGTVPEKMVIGRAFMIVWPPGRWRVLQIPATFEQSGITRTAALGAPAVPFLPLAGGVAAALPVTWLERRIRLRRRRARRR
jgi:signal peptidase I